MTSMLDVVVVVVAVVIVVAVVVAVVIVVVAVAVVVAVVLRTSCLSLSYLSSFLFHLLGVVVMAVILLSWLLPLLTSS